MYFDNSMYESDLHYRITQYLDEDPLGPDWEELKIDASSTDEYNQRLDQLVKYGEDLIVTSGIPNNPTEIIVEKDPRENYRQFDESMLMESREVNDSESNS